MECLFCKKKTKSINEKDHNELRKEFMDIKELPAFQGHTPGLVADMKIKKIIKHLRENYCERCTHEQLRYMGRDQVERLLAKTEI
jgi:hypothetical protein